MQIDGFSFSAVKAGVRYPNRLDIGLIYSDKPCVIAGVYTTNLVKAAPVVIDEQRIKSGEAQAILVNSGCANACTGEIGMEIALATSKLLSDRLAIDDTQVQLSSTGVIGEQLNIKAFEDNIEELVTNLSPGNFHSVAEAIMTTDTVPKTSEVTVTIGSKEVKIMGMAKGAGMIMPNMATMLSFVVTDAQIGPSTLKTVLARTTEKTFNRITVDGDTSTNDMVLVMANGTAGNDLLSEGTGEDLQMFENALQHLLKDLALQIVSDGEGANKCITISVGGAKTDEDAEQLARTVATSSLVKTAFFGEDANWGRILAAMGRSGVRFNPDTVDLAFDKVKIMQNGMGVGSEVEDAAAKVLKERDITVKIDLQEGSGSAEVYTCDFSIDYVKINSDYRS